MTSENLSINNRKYIYAIEYVKKLYELGLITKEEMRKANRYYAKLFQASFRIFI